MTIPQTILNQFDAGLPVAAEVATSSPDMIGYVMVIPCIPTQQENPDAWVQTTHRLPRLKDASYITGYEVRYLLHHRKYTDTDWGMDYDYVLDDTTTRVKRMFVKHEDEIEAIVEQWLPDVSMLQEPGSFDSSLVNSPLDYYLNRPAERPHLWLE